MENVGVIQDRFQRTIFFDCFFEREFKGTFFNMNGHYVTQSEEQYSGYNVVISDSQNAS